MEGEARVGERLGQVRRGAVQRVEGQVVLPHIQRLGGHQPRDPGHRLGLPHDEILLLAQLGPGQEGGPVHARRLGAQVGLLPGVGALGHVVGFFLGGMGLGDPGLQRQDALGLGRRIGHPGQLQHLGDIGLVLLAQLGHAAALQVEVAVRQAQAALHQVRRGAVRLQQVHRHPHPEQAVGVEVGGIEQVHVRAQGAAQGGGQGGLVGDAADGVQFRLDRSHAPRFDPGLVHECGVVVADQLGFAAGLGIGGGAFEDGTRIGQGLLGDDIEAAVAGAVGRDLGVLHPGAVGKAEEVIAGGDAAVHPGRIEAEAAQLRLGRGGGGGCLVRGGRGRGGRLAVAGGQPQRQAGGNGKHQGGAAQLGH
ncbi:hypothetical protein D3C71_1156450 [compost metagenome]